MLVSWSSGDTHDVDFTRVYYRATDSAEWTHASATGTQHNVTSLQPGTEYQFFVEIGSHGKSATSENITATTGMIYVFILLLHAVWIST